MEGSLLRHWLALFNSFLLTFAVLPVLEPILRRGSLSGPADDLWSVYSVVCQQLPGHSYFLLGQQMAYCQRNTAIYTTMALCGLLWARWGCRLPSLSAGVLGLLALPLALDGLSQAIGLR